MDNHTRTAAEETAIIVVNALRTHTSLCIPGATDVRSAAEGGPPPSRTVVEVPFVANVAIPQPNK
jgi:hypothetical protein